MKTLLLAFACLLATAQAQDPRYTGASRFCVEAGVGNQLLHFHSNGSSFDELISKEMSPAIAVRASWALPKAKRIGMGLEASWAKGDYTFFSYFMNPSGISYNSHTYCSLNALKIMGCIRLNWLYRPRINGYFSVGAGVQQGLYSSQSLISRPTSDELLPTVQAQLPVVAARAAAGLQVKITPLLGVYAEVGYAGRCGQFLSGGVCVFPGKRSPQ